jgi:hypothetical protein
MAKRKADSLPGRSTKRSRSRQDEVLEDLTHGPSIREQAEPYRLATARFPLDALTSAWSVGSNRHLDSKQVEILCQIFEKQRLQREPEENRLRIACSRAEIKRMMEHLEQASQQPLETSSSWPFFRDWMLINGCPAEIMAGQHRIEALKVFLTRKDRPRTSPDDDPHWWLCDVYDRGTLLVFPPRLNGHLTVYCSQMSCLQSSASFFVPTDWITRSPTTMVRSGCNCLRSPNKIRRSSKALISRSKMRWRRLRTFADGMSSQPDVW